MMAYVECMRLGFGLGELFILSSLLLPILALIDILRHEFTGSNKLIWILVVILVPIVGPILYLFIGQKDKIKP